MEQHSTIGCKITHIIGIPLLLLSAVQLSLPLLILALALLSAGHYCFEKNEPVFIQLLRKLFADET